MVEEIKYIPYGNDEIDYNEFLTRAANNVQDYVAGRSWSTKRKKDFMNAYADIMSHGITGASVGEDGRWGINYTGTIDMDTKTDRQKEMYGAAAHFIQLLMKSIPIHKKEEEKKEDLPEMDYPTFESNFSKAFANKWFNGNTAIRNDWNNFDKRDETTGKRGIDERKKKMIEFLEEYHNNFDESKYSNGADIKGKIKGALDALKSDNPDDDKEAFTRLGMNYDQFFDNGLNDDSGYFLKDRNLTWAEYIKYQLDKKAQDAKDAAAKAKAVLQQAYNNTQFYNRVTNNKMLGQNAATLKLKYGNTAALVQALNNYAQLDIRSLTPDLISEVQGAYRYLANSPIDALTLRNLQNSSSGLYRGAAPNRFRKINGVNNLIWDSATGQVIQISNRLQMVANALNLDLFKGIKTSQELQLIPRGGGNELTSADIRDIGATLLDLTALVSPGIVSGTAAALGAAGARTWNRVAEKGLFSGIFNWDNALDWGTALVGGTPIWGDTTSFAKFARGFGKLMTIPAVINAAQSIPEAKAAWDKIDSNNLIDSLKRLTPADYHAIANVLTGVIGGRNYFRSNLAERQVLQHSGVDVTAASTWRNKAQAAGLLRTKPAKSVATPTAKVKVNDKDIEVLLTDKLKTKLEGELKKAGTNAEARNKAVKETLKDSELTTTNGSKVKIKDTDNVSISAPSKIRDRSWVWGPFRTNRNVFGTTLVGATRSQGDFEEWLATRSNWNKLALGSNRNMRAIQNKLGLLSGAVANLAASLVTQSNLNPLQGAQSLNNTSTRKVKQNSLSKEESTELLSTLRGKNFGKNEFKDESRVIGSVKGFGDLYGIRNSDGTHTLQLDLGGTRINVTGTKADIKSKALETLRKDVMKRIDAQIPKANRARIKYELTQLLKLNGYLKHGGLLQYKKDNTIENFLKEYNL